MKPRNREVLDLLRSLPTVTLMDATRALGISGGGFTKAVSDLRRRHGFKIAKQTKRDPLTGTRYPVYTLAT
jgi:translation elongation factor EF-Ts